MLRNGIKIVTIINIMLTILFEFSLSASAKHTGERAGSIRIEAKKELAIDLDSSIKSRSELVIIQFIGPIQDNWIEEVEKWGAMLGDYIPDYAFIAKLADPKIRKQIEKLTYVEGVVPFQPVTKVAPALRSALGKNRSVDIAVVGFDQQVNMRRTVTDLVPEEEIEAIQTMEDASHITIATMNAQSLQEVILSEDVIAVIPVPENKLHNDIAAVLTSSDALLSTGYSGKGQIIGVADTGLDTGEEANIHPDFQGQIKSLYARGRKGDASDRHGHGTHIAGTLVGSGDASGGAYTGLAPDAQLVFHSMQDRYGALLIDVETFLSQSYKDGARIHSDSWGADDEGEYSLTSFLFDRFLWEHPDMTALIAAGNTGYGGFQTVGSPATAKNAIAVGATESDRPDLGDWSDEPDHIWHYSSSGLTADGRLKPDIVAPGTAILSTRSSLAPNKNFDRRYDEYYAYMSGTSMATPVAAAGIAQIRQFLNEQGHKNPSSALLKSILLTGADDLGEDMRLQGFGRVNLLQAIETDYVDEKKGLRTKEKRTYSVKVTDTTMPFVITLAWTDYPASLVANRALVNDLNLQVITPDGEKRNGNDFFEAPYDDEVDNLNNVEQVWIGKPEAGIYHVTVEGYNIPKGPQAYALATTGKWMPVESHDHDEDESEKDVIKGQLSKKQKFVDYSIRVSKPGKLKASVEWEGDADIDLYVFDHQKKIIASAKRTDNPETVSLKLAKAGSYQIRVRLDEGEEAQYRLRLSYPGK
ncbi:S8 family serine peptidase [Brevibacillus reuszeri]|uniref:S8 family serine peptidase n=1 Tax=Brevibacillus reuszeri TaxID=54915 RepID=UPI00366F4232